MWLYLRSQDIKIEVSENLEQQDVARTGSGLPGDWRPLNTSNLLESSVSLPGVLSKAYVLSGCCSLEIHRTIYIVAKKIPF